MRHHLPHLRKGRPHEPNNFLLGEPPVHRLLDEHSLFGIPVCLDWGDDHTLDHGLILLLLAKRPHVKVFVAVFIDSEGVDGVYQEAQGEVLALEGLRVFQSDVDVVDVDLDVVDNSQ